MRAVERTLARALPHLRALLAVAVLVVPVALVAPGFVRDEVRVTTGHGSAFTLPFGVPGRQYNKPLIVGIVTHVPPHASLATVGERLGTAWTRWVPYVIAPRQLTTAPERWTVVLGETPQQAQLRPVHSWRYGADWLVER